MASSHILLGIIAPLHSTAIILSGYPCSFKKAATVVPSAIYSISPLTLITTNPSPRHKRAPILTFSVFAKVPCKHELWLITRIKKAAQRTTPVVVYPFMRLNIKIHNHSHNSHKPNELLHSDLIITFFNHLSTPYSACIPSKTYFVRHKTLTFPKQKPYQTFPVNPPIYYTKSRNCSLFSHFILIKILLRVIILSE